MNKFVIEGRLVSLNEFINTERTNRFAGANLKKKQQELITSYLNEVDTFNSKVRLEFTWYEPNNRRDVDNVIFAQKFILDAMVNKGILPDDNRSFVSEVSHKVLTDKDNPRIEVTIHLVE